VLRGSVHLLTLNVIQDIPAKFSTFESLVQSVLSSSILPADDVGSVEITAQLIRIFPELTDYYYEEILILKSLLSHALSKLSIQTTKNLEGAFSLLTRNSSFVQPEGKIGFLHAM